jgi:hypothetical protein
VNWSILGALCLGLALLLASALPRRVVAVTPLPVGHHVQLVAGLMGVTLAVGAFVALLASA